MSVTVVEDDEFLYRRVSATSDWYYCSDGQYMINQAAFQDRGRAPSVDRAALLPNNDPRRTQLDSNAGVFRIRAGDVRNIGPIRTITGQVHRVDVIHAPSRDNNAHALIIIEPEFDQSPAGNRASRQLRMALARLVNQTPPVFILEPNRAGMTSKASRR